jgi:hypothetical protein
MDAENNYGNLVVGVFAEKGSGKRNQCKKKEKNRVYICEIPVNIFCIYRHEKVMRPPIGKQEGEREKVAYKERDHRPDCERQLYVAGRVRKHRRLDFKNEHRHNYRENTVGKLF